MAEMFKEQGYKTACFGKWHLGWQKEFLPLQHGFDEYVGLPYSYFKYGWGWQLAHGSLIDYPELQKPLGDPKGAYHRTSSTDWEFTREFKHASVWVNTETRKAKITWH